MTKLTQILKKDGSLEQFNIQKLITSIEKTLTTTKTKNPTNTAKKHAQETLTIIEKNFGKDVQVSSQDIRDIVIEILEKHKLPNAAKAYAEHKQHEKAMIGFKTFMGIRDDIGLTPNALKILAKRYLLRNEQGTIIETPSRLFKRVAKTIAEIDSKYQKGNITKTEQEFYNTLSNLEFIPNTPTLMNTGTQLGQLAACFVLNVGDSLKEIFSTIQKMVILHQSGGGTGFNFSNLRPKGDIVKSTKGVASGPVSFMTVFDKATDVIKQGGKRRGANMAILNVDHPDILEFINAKTKQEVLSNFNISVAVTDSFMECAEKNKEYPLINPRTKKETKKANAKEIFDSIISSAWQTGDPGIIFIDEINRKNPTPTIGKIESTNPCVTGDTLVSTAQGLQRARDLCNIPLTVITDGRISTTISQQSTPMFITGTKPVLKLVTREGYEVRLTADHKVYTTRGWIPAKDLSQNDKIFIQNRKGSFGIHGTLEEGRILGWLVGDSTFSISKSAILSFFGEKQLLAPIFSSYIRTIIEDQIDVVKVKERDKSHVSSQHLQKTFEEFSLTSAKNITVSDVIFTGSEQLQRGFIQGIFNSDGHIGGTFKKGYSIRLTSISESFLKDIQRILINFGIASKLYSNRHPECRRLLPDGKGGYAEYICKSDHNLVISRDNMFRFLDEIGFLSETKQNKLIKACISYMRKPWHEPFIAHFKQLIPYGEEIVYDLTEPVTHSFIANGIIVHNCGEQPLLPNESCTLGSINLLKFVKNEKIEWDKLKKTVHTAVHFLDNVIDANNYPIPEIEQITKANRKIGLGVMGFAEMLIKLEIPYNSDKAIEIAEKLMKFISDESHKKSQELGQQRGNFLNFKNSIWDTQKIKTMRNATTTTIAPTGTISLIAGVSSGIEPLFAISFIRNVMEGTKLLEVTPLFEEIAKKRGFYTKALMLKVVHKGSINEMKEIPTDVRKLFVTSFDIEPEWHVKIQAAFQKFTDNAVSKTVNLPFKAKLEDVKKIYLLAHKLKCKGITVYRTGSKPQQVLYVPKTEETINVDEEFSGNCPGGTCGN